MSDVTTTTNQSTINVTKPLSPSKSSPATATNQQQQQQLSPTGSASQNAAATATAHNNSNSSVVSSSEKVFQTRLPWGTLKEKHNYYFYPNPNQPTAHTQHLTNLDNVAIERKKPGEYAMHLMTLNFIHCCSKKFDTLINGDKRVRID